MELNPAEMKSEICCKFKSLCRTLFPKNASSDLVLQLVGRMYVPVRSQQMWKLFVKEVEENRFILFLSRLELKKKGGEWF